MLQMAKEMVEVNKQNIFEVMVRAHYQNLQQALPYFSNGTILGLEGEVLEEGRDECPHYKGLYLFYDGKDVLGTVAERVARKKNPFKEPVAIPNQESFLEQVCGGNKNTDVVLAYNTAERTMTAIKSEMSNECEDMDELLETHLPYNFVSKDGSVPVYEAGTKTGNAALSADVLNKPIDRCLRALLVKRSAYSDLRFGKIAEFGPDGLTREFFFDYAPEHKGPFVDAERKIIGVYREYHRVDGNLVPKLENHVNFSANGEVLYTPVSDTSSYRKSAVG